MLSNRTQEEVLLSLDNIQEHTGHLPKSYRYAIAFKAKGKYFYNACTAKGYIPVAVRHADGHIVAPNEVIDLSRGVGYVVVLKRQK